MDTLEAAKKNAMPLEFRSETQLIYSKKGKFVVARYAGAVDPWEIKDIGGHPVVSHRSAMDGGEWHDR